MYGSQRGSKSTVKVFIFIYFNKLWKYVHLIGFWVKFCEKMTILWFWPFGTTTLKWPSGSFFSKLPLYVSKNVSLNLESCKMWISSDMRSFVCIGAGLLAKRQFEMLKMAPKLGRQPKIGLFRGSLMGCCWHENGCKCNF